ncbi:MAG TPA: nucleotide exchange factor GrpE [Kofleriaceae bacterium]|nr:nucleotide exchange factor GrpE [Kofleriaceae bacterium]
MSDDGDKPVGGTPDDEPFDAIAAAAELSEALGGEAAHPTGAGASFADILEEEVEALQQELAKKDTVIAQKDALIARAEAHAAEARADVEKAKERINREAERRADGEIRKVLLPFLEVLDDLDRALGATRDAASADSVLEGVELVKRRFLGVLARHGVAPMISLGARFDPNQHEAVTLVPVTESSQDGHVVAVMREGYVMGDGVLRPANVAVGRAGG